MPSHKPLQVTNRLVYLINGDRMDEACNLRIQRLEHDVKQHDSAIKTQGDSLNKIVQLVAQIRWMGVGALGFFILSKIGFLEAVKHILGL